MTITLTPDQEKGKLQLISFLANPTQPVMVIEGYSGTGKSTLVNTFLDELPLITKTVKLIHPTFKDFDEVIITATTNKAAEALSGILNQPVKTIYSALGLRLKYNFKKNKQILVQADESFQIYDSLILIDEASYADKVLLDYIFKITRRCKIVLMGDPAQLINQESKTAPVFEMGYPTVKLTEVVRQKATNQIQALSTMFRNAVNTKVFQHFTPNGVDVVYLNRIDFDDAVVNEFTRPDWTQSDARVLCWTNAKAEVYNKGLTQLTKGSARLGEGDYVVCNSHVTKGKAAVKTDAMVRISKLTTHTVYDVVGELVQLTGYQTDFFLPHSLQDKKNALQRAVTKGDSLKAYEIQNEWIDLRATFASTINKSQGSTYDRVYIDLDDINRCRDAETIARLMYVGVSRARFIVYLTGTLS